MKKQRHYFADKGPSSQSYAFLSSYVWIWELDHKESWVPKNWCIWTVVLEKILQSPLDFKIKPVNPKGNQTEYSLEGLMLKLKFQYFGHQMRRTDSLKKNLDAGNDWRQEKGTTDMSLSKLRELWWTEKPGVLQFVRSRSRTWLSNWTSTTQTLNVLFSSQNSILLF